MGFVGDDGVSAERGGLWILIDAASTILVCMQHQVSYLSRNRLRDSFEHSAKHFETQKQHRCTSSTTY